MNSEGKIALSVHDWVTTVQDPLGRLSSLMEPTLCPREDVLASRPLLQYSDSASTSVQIALILRPTLRVLFTLSGRLPAQNRVNGPQKRSDNVVG
jgi:hypothetical protein